MADRNRFVVACLTGLRFSDFSLIEPHDLRNGLLYKKQKKSDHWVVIPLRKEAQQMLEQLFRVGRLQATRILIATSKSSENLQALIT